MQAKIDTLKMKNSSGEDYLVYPRTLIKCVTNEKGDSLETTLKEFIEENVDEVLDETLSGTYAEKTYTDTGDANTLASAKEYTDSETATTLSAAKTYAETQASSALNDAKGYTDTKIDSIVGEGASETLDTIGEISKAIEEHQDVTDALNAAIGNKANTSDLAKVATSGKYSDLSGVPTIPTKTSQLTNDSGYKTTDNNTTYTLTKSGSTITLTGSDGSKTSVTDADTNTTYNLGSFGITATATELNYTDGVTSNIQTQLNSKVVKRLSTGTSYIQLGDYYNSGSTAAYIKISFPVVPSWTMMNMELTVRQNYGSAQYGKIHIYANQSATQEWNQFYAVTYDRLTENIKVYGSDKQHIYIGGVAAWGGLSVDRLLIGDSATSSDLSNVTITGVSELPTTHQIATMYRSIHSGNIGSQSVNYATSAGSANAVAWGNVSGKPSSFTPASHSQAASTITAGTFGGAVVAPASTAYTTNQLRNGVFTTTDPGAGASSSYANGSIIYVYE